MDPRQRQSSTAQLIFQHLLDFAGLRLIENPLRYIPEDYVDDYIEVLYEGTNLSSVIDITTLVRGAHLARQEEAFIAKEDALRTLTDIERGSVDKEKHTTSWTGTRELKIILLTCALYSVFRG